MKKAIIISILLFFGIKGFSQDSSKVNSRVNEIGITFFNLNQFGATYRLGNDKAL